MLCIYFTSHRVVSLRAAWVTFDAPVWLDRDPYVFIVVIINFKIMVIGNIYPGSSTCLKVVFREVLHPIELEFGHVDR